MALHEPVVFGWDIGGAHVKACLMQDGRVTDVMQWPCPLWQGLPHLQQVITSAHERWPDLGEVRHAVTMTGEMVDLFDDREDGVCRIAEILSQALAGPRSALHFFAGRAGWCGAEDAASRWRDIASANWLASAMHAARHVDEGVLVDIGSTTTDLIALRHGRVLVGNRVEGGLAATVSGCTDAERLASGALVYHGVTRTPLCAVAPRIALRGTVYNVMNEWFASSADVYRLTGELNPAHDQHPSADGKAKDLQATCQRLARMVGLDARDASEADWRACARAWRAAQLTEIGGQLERVCADHAIDARAPLVSAGCGDFLVEALAASTGRRCLRYAEHVAALAPQACATARQWAQVCAPSIAVAALLASEPC